VLTIHARAERARRIVARQISVEEGERGNVSSLGTLGDHVRAGFSQTEAEQLESLALRCDTAAAEAAKFHDDELLQLVMEACQSAIDSFTRW
jgi:hypothetical protein